MSRDGKYTGGRKWVKGKPGGPGRPKLPETVKASMKMNHATITNCINSLRGKSIIEIVAIAKNPDADWMLACFASVIAHSLKEGDMTRLDKLFDRGVGRVKQILQVEKMTIDSFEFTEEPDEE